MGITTTYPRSSHWPLSVAGLILLFGRFIILTANFNTITALISEKKYDSASRGQKSHLLANHIDLTKHERAKCKWSEIKRAKVELESFWTAAKIDISICGARKSKNMGLIRKSPLIAENKTDTSDPATDQVTETDQSSI